MGGTKWFIFMLLYIYMSNDLSDIKKDFDKKIADLRERRKVALKEYKEKIREAKIKKIRNLIINE